MDAPTNLADRFAADYLKHRQKTPFPWQLAAARRLSGGWPRLAYVAVPTGCGKTCIVDLWHSCSPRRRLVYVINRRIVVDTVYDYAKPLPVTVALLRGGLPPDERTEWWLWPEERQVLVSTIDQAGSALLGQAYGHGAKAAPVLQGLVGTDCLWVVDEAHLETPFVKTLRDCQAAGADIDIVLMSATPEDLPADIPVFKETEDDRKHPVLSLRLRPDRLQARHQAKDKDKGPAALAEEAKRLRKGKEGKEGKEGAAVVLVVCNTVKTARDTFEILREEGEAALITGRVRQADRDRHVQEHLLPILAGTRPPLGASPGLHSKTEGRAQLDLFEQPQEQGEPPPPRPTLYLVATSAIEVGADIDCDALVGEKCEEAQQIQRQGRVNRLGELPSAPVSILKPEKPFAFKKPVPPLWLPEDLAVRFDPDPWLHGYGEDLATVDVVWREDLPLAAAEQEGYFEALPVMAHETMPVPRWSFNNWLKRINREAVWLNGGTAVVRCEWGGADKWGWNPEAIGPVSDVAERYDTDADGNRVKIVRIRLKEGEDVPEGLKARPIPGQEKREKNRVAFQARDWSLGEKPVLLKDHLRAVGDEAAALAEDLGYDPGVFRKAGKAHDIGKADPTFQLRLGGDENRRLAKSDPATAVPPNIAGVPKGWRHEFASVEKRLGKADPLVCYLVGTHHGHGRPWFAPPHETPLEWLELVLELRRQHNPWQLAALEAILRIADWRVSMRDE